ncbi:MAG TPA: bifunctional glutamate N-acetyltransferase/amino-acid acetyltransferase ArgJ [Gemmatimonadaceae bacterium]
MAKSTVPPSPFAPERLPEMPQVAGVKFAACAAGIRYAGRTDLMLAVLNPGTTVAGVLTRSKTSSAPVLWCRQNLAKGQARALVVNSGNANAFTGKKGAEATRMTAAAAAAAVDCAPDEVYVSSTGVIGEPLDASKFAHLLEGLAKAAAPDAWHAAARAIMTTDTFPKLAARAVRLGNADVVINGFAKGAGMIAPDLATMLVYIFTDAAIGAPQLDRMLRDAAHVSFNMLSVDSDTSTSDTCVLMANGMAGAVDAAEFASVLTAGCIRMTEMLARDGEGAKHLLRATVRGAATESEARRIAKSLVNSPLVKTMVYGADPNVGRILMAVGKCFDCTLRPESTDAWINGHSVVRGGLRLDFDEAELRTALAAETVDIGVSLGIADGTATAYGCDLTPGYIEENAAYYSS